MEYKGDNRETTMQEIEKILIEYFGKEGNDSGCYHNGKWLSINSVLETISNNI